MKALYDLTRDVASFNIFPWLVMAKAAGASEIVFNPAPKGTEKYPRDVLQRRYESIIKPAPALVGLPWSEGHEGERLPGKNFREFVAWLSEGNRFTPLRAPRHPGAKGFTVTLRQTARAPNRNSNREAWTLFAAETGAHVIPDYDDAPLSLAQRLDLYSGAEMNYFVTNGPAYLCWLAGLPCTIFVRQFEHYYHDAMGFLSGTQLPGSRPDQRHVWADDTLGHIRVAHRRFVQCTAA
jgi:hypothetical protein